MKWAARGELHLDSAAVIAALVLGAALWVGFTYRFHTP